MERITTTLSVEARAFKEGAVKVRRFDSIAEADAWLLGIRQQHEGVRFEVIQHRTALGFSQRRTEPALREWKPVEDAVEGAGFGISGDGNGGPRRV